MQGTTRDTHGYVDNVNVSRGRSDGTSVRTIDVFGISIDSGWIELGID